MLEEAGIKNKIAESGLINFDISTLRPKGKRIGMDLKDFLFEEIILREKDFRAQVSNLETGDYENAFVHIYCSADAIVPLWAYFLLTAKITSVAKKVVFGNAEDLEVLLMHDAITENDFSALEGKRVLVNGCSEFDIPENAYVELVEVLKPKVKALMFGEACSNVPIFKN